MHAGGANAQSVTDMIFSMLNKIFLRAYRPKVGYGTNVDRSQRLCEICELAVWLSGNALDSINVIALRQTRLVSGWMTVCERVNHLGM